ncbi:VOC family protein [Priestia flexa]|uniref:VOC family protein n=1 Tax=Priestia flexa TaxID=86664 RepID=UPI0028931B27|nr:VOC family protein [Priestia flexa]
MSLNGGDSLVYSLKRIDHVQLAAPPNSENEARRFFHELLGFQEVQKPTELQKNGGVWFTLNNCELHIGIEQTFIPAQKAHPAFEVENLFALKKHLTTHHVPFIQDEKLLNANRIYVNDPFGNRLEFLEWV